MQTPVMNQSGLALRNIQKQTVKTSTSKSKLCKFCTCHRNSPISKCLRIVERFKSVFICPDRTRDKLKSRQEAVALLRVKTQENPGKPFFIRNNKELSD